MGSCERMFALPLTLLEEFVADGLCSAMRGEVKQLDSTEQALCDLLLQRPRRGSDGGATVTTAAASSVPAAHTASKALNGPTRERDIAAMPSALMAVRAVLALSAHCCAAR